MSANAPLILGSLFRGIGGIDKGFEDAGIVPSWSVEIDPSCNAVARRHWPGVPIVADVRQAGQCNLTPVDIIAFGSPCQDLSLAGKRKGLEGERSGLFFEAGRVIRELRPQLAVWENVPGAFSSYTATEPAPGGLPPGSRWDVEEDSDFAAVLSEMEKCGALDIAWRVLDSQWFGVAQRRRRIILVADFRARRAAEILALAESLSGHPAPRRQAGETIAGTVESRVGGGGFPGTDGACANHVVPAVTSKWAKGSGGPAGDECQNLVFTVQSNDGGAHKRPDRPNGGLYVKRTDTALTVGTTDQTLIAFEPGNLVRRCGASPDEHVVGTLGADKLGDTFPHLAYGISQEQTDKATLEVMPTMKSRESGGGQMQAVAFTERTRRDGRSCECSGDVAYALNNPGAGGRTQEGRVAHNMIVRRLTPTECERLQGFPDGWTAWGLDATGNRIEMSDTARYRMLGNAVTRTVAFWLGKRIVNTMRETR